MAYSDDECIKLHKSVSVYYLSTNHCRLKVDIINQPLLSQGDVQWILLHYY